MLHLSPYLTCGFHLSLRSNRLVNLPTLYASYLKKSSFWINMTVQKISRKMRALVWEENLMRVSFFFYLIFNTKITYWTKLIGQNLVKQNFCDLKIIYSPFVQKENRRTNFGHF